MSLMSEVPLYSFARKEPTGSSSLHKCTVQHFLRSGKRAFATLLGSRGFVSTRTQKWGGGFRIRYSSISCAVDSAKRREFLLHIAYLNVSCLLHMKGRVSYRSFAPL